MRVNKLKEELKQLINEDSKFKPGDFVIYHSTSGPSYHCFAKVVEYKNPNKVKVQLLAKYDGKNNLDLVSEDGFLVVPEFKLDLGIDALNRKIDDLKSCLSRLEKLQKEL